MKPTVYIETTVVSYLASRGSNVPIVAAQMSSTHDWWNRQRGNFDLVVSQLVIAEASAGDPVAAAERLSHLQAVRSMPLTDVAVEPAADLLHRAAVPARARLDALHVAVCATNAVAYLLTWNCRHLANAVLRPRIEAACRDYGYNPPVICTPRELEVSP